MECYWPYVVFLWISIWFFFFFYKHSNSVQVIQPYNSSDTATTWKKLPFIREIRFPHDRKAAKSSPRLLYTYFDIASLYTYFDIAAEEYELVK